MGLMRRVLETLREQRVFEAIQQRRLCRAAVLWRRRSLELGGDDGAEALREIDRDLVLAVEAYEKQRGGSSWHRPPGGTTWTCRSFPLMATVKPSNGDVGGFQWHVGLDADGWCKDEEEAMQRAALVAEALCAPLR